jgi:hypothetical protein
MQAIKVDKEYVVRELYALIYKLEPDQEELKQDILKLVSFFQTAPSSGSQFPRINGSRLG